MYELSKSEQVTLKLIKSDLVFINTVRQNPSLEISGASYLVAFFSYIALIIDGCEQWGNKVKAFKNFIPNFSSEEKAYYEEARKSIKLWDTSYFELYRLLNEKYDESYGYYSSNCSPYEKLFKIFDIYGVYKINENFCDNTVLDMLFFPNYSLDNEPEKQNGEKQESKNSKLIRKMAEFTGKMISSFGIKNDDLFSINPNIIFNLKDYGGFIKSPVGNKFSDKFVILSLLCTINFIIYGIDKYITQEIPIKLRASYIQYFYIVQQLPKINNHLNTTFKINDSWFNDKIRNCMAHYALGVVLKPYEIVEEDIFGGLTQKYLKQDWVSLKGKIIKELLSLSEQITDFLGI